MRCSVCGRENLPGARFCAQCGASLPMGADESLQPGQTMNSGQYRVVRALGQGGMGAIYLAQNTQAFDRLCVIKEMIPYFEPGKEREAQERFEQEARTLAALKHPGIPDIYGYFSEKGHHYIVMEYIEGENLEHSLTHENRSGERIVGQPVDAEQVVHYSVQICRVLEYLAQVKLEPVVHCDIKPANIIIDKNSQQAVLVDFGTARARYLRSMQGQPDDKRSSVYGTVGYAAPELYRGQVVPKSDVFSLAATVYHLLTDDDPRDHPFKWPQMERVNASLRLILEHALVNEVDQRLDAEQFRRQLEAYRAAQAGTVRPLTFPDGNLATTLTGVLDLAARYWEYTRQILYDGSLDAWLRNTLNDPVAANRAADAVQEYPGAPDAGLDAFVRGLNPRMPASKLTLSASQVDLGTVAPGEDRPFELTLTNHGPGGSHGSIKSSDLWLRVSPGAYALAPGGHCVIQMRLVATEHLAMNKRHVARVLLSASTGQTLEAEVYLEVGRRATPRPVTVTTISTGPKPAQAAVRASTGAVPRAKPKPAQPRSGARKMGILFVLLVALLAVAVGLVYLVPRGTRGVDLQGGLLAIQQGEWQRMARDLAWLDPQSREQVEQVGRALDEAMVHLPGGTLVMGREDGAPDERPAHEVQVADLSMDRFEVTNVQYQRFVNETGHRAPRSWAGGYYPLGRALYPVVGVSWEDARAYAGWAGKRLPTEAEWEWAARGAEGRLYPWGNELDPAQANFKSSAQTPKGTAPVGSFPKDATPEGIMDLGGNVREWTADRYGPYRVPHAPPTEGSQIAVRGKSWQTYNDAASSRDRMAMDAAAEDLGFRCVQ